MTLPVEQATRGPAIQTVKLEQTGDRDEADQQNEDRRNVLGKERMPGRHEPRDKHGQGQERIGDETLIFLKVRIEQNRRTSRRSVELGIVLTNSRSGLHRRKHPQLNGLPMTEPVPSLPITHFIVLRIRPARQANPDDPPFEMTGAHFTKDQGK